MDRASAPHRETADYYEDQLRLDLCSSIHSYTHLAPTEPTQAPPCRWLMPRPTPDGSRRWSCVASLHCVAKSFCFSTRKASVCGVACLSLYLFLSHLFFSRPVCGHICSRSLLHVFGLSFTSSTVDSLLDLFHCPRIFLNMSLSLLLSTSQWICSPKDNLSPFSPTHLPTSSLPQALPLSSLTFGRSTWRPSPRTSAMISCRRTTRASLATTAKSNCAAPGCGPSAGAAGEATAGEATAVVRDTWLQHHSRLSKTVLSLPFSFPLLLFFLSLFLAFCAPVYFILCCSQSPSPCFLCLHPSPFYASLSLFRFVSLPLSLPLSLPILLLVSDRRGASGRWPHPSSTWTDR